MEKAHQIIIENAKKYFRENYQYATNEKGELSYELSTDYRDVLSDDAIEKAFEKSSIASVVRDYLYEYLCDINIDYIGDEEYSISKQVLVYLESSLPLISKELLEEEGLLEVSEIRDILMEQNVLSVTMDFDEIIARSNVNMIISLENKVSENHEFSLNDFHGSVLEWIENTQELLLSGELEESDISLISLLKTQGYSFKGFMVEAEKCFGLDNYKPKSRFMESLINECYNTSSCCNALVFTSKVNLLDFIKDENKLKSISRDMYGGYVDFVYGGGSTLELKLEKDIPLDSVSHSMFVDGSSRNKYGYSLKSIYGEFISNKR